MTIKKITEGLFVLPEDNLDLGYLIGSKCKKCQTVSFPRRIVCPICQSHEIDLDIPLNKQGTLYSYAINQMAPEGFKAPYITGKIDLPEKIRIFSVITGCSVENDLLEIGMKMELVFETLRQDILGNNLISYKFRPMVSEAPESDDMD